MVRIRLRRVGLKNQPSYRIVVQDKESPRDGRFIEIIGFYNPRTEPATITIDEAMTDKRLLGAALVDTTSGRVNDTWTTWRAVSAASSRRDTSSAWDWRRS